MIDFIRAPCIIFVDEIDNLCGRREALNQEQEKRIVSLFSNLIDQVNLILSILYFIHITSL